LDVEDLHRTRTRTQIEEQRVAPGTLRLSIALDNVLRHHTGRPTCATRFTSRRLGTGAQPKLDALIRALAARDDES
jgi:hypothetical protein